MKAEHFKSGLAYMFKEFVLKLKAEGKYSKTYRTNLHCFDNYVAENYPGKEVLEEDMLEWVVQRETETASSCRTRTAVVRVFFSYAFLKGWMDECEIIVPQRDGSQFIPHFFTEDELDKFFIACDEFAIENYNKCKSFASFLNKIQLPVYFRLLYSCGFRTCELRELMLIDIDIDRGIFYIRKSKNRCERMVVLDDSVIVMLKEYLRVLNSVMPDSEWLFPNSNRNHRSDYWQCHYFRKIWGRISDEEARAYDFRHTHITLNISSWSEKSYEFDGRLIVLKRFVGHTNIQQTAEYFQFTPMLVEKLKGTFDKRFKDLCPTPPKIIDD